MSNFQSILEAVDKYAEQTGINLKENPFADKVKGCDSPDAVLLLLQENMNAFKEYRDQDRKFIDCMSPVVQFVHVFSGILGEASGLVSRELSFRCRLFTFPPKDTVPTCKANLRRNRCSLHCACLPHSLTGSISYPSNLRRPME